MHRTNHQDHMSRIYRLRLGSITLCTAILTSSYMLTARANEEPQAAPIQAAEETQVTVASILENPIDQMAVTLQGEILQPGDDKGEYIFTDGTGEITLENYDEAFSFPPNTLIEISGEVNLESKEEIQQETHPEDVEIDVNEFQVIDP